MRNASARKNEPRPASTVQRYVLGLAAVAAMVLGAATLARAAPDAAVPDDPSAATAVRTGQDAFGDWRQDAPGVTRLIRPADLPPPYATLPAAHSPRIVAPPPGFVPKVPEGFAVTRFADKLDAPRNMIVAPNGDVFVAESAVGRVKVLRPSPVVDRAVAVETFASRLFGPFGLAFYPSGPDPRWLYVAAENRIVRYPYRVGDMKTRGLPEVVVAALPTGGHSTRSLAFSKDGKRMFVAIGSQSNVAEGMPAKSIGDAKAYDIQRGATGAGWDGETNRAAVLSFTPEGSDGKIYATGLRNCVGLAIDPVTGDPWCSTNERDGLGDDLVPDYITRVRDGGFYGWPWYYIGDHEEPRLKGLRPDLAGKAIVPDVLLQPHSASLGLAFYDAKQFPQSYLGNAFAAEHGSWNRSRPTGYKVIRILMKDGVPTGAYQDFMTGFVLSDDQVAGRPVGVAVAGDGSLLVSDDGNGVIWRVAVAK